MKSYAEWSFIISVAASTVAVLMVGIHRAGLSSFRGDPLGTVILFYLIAAIAWFNALVALGLAWRNHTLDHAAKWFFIQLFIVPLATLILNGLAFKFAPNLEDSLKSKIRFLKGIFK